MDLQESNKPKLTPTDLVKVFAESISSLYGLPNEEVEKIALTSLDLLLKRMNEKYEVLHDIAELSAKLCVEIIQGGQRAEFYKSLVAKLVENNYLELENENKLT